MRRADRILGRQTPRADGEQLERMALCYAGLERRTRRVLFGLIRLRESDRSLRLRTLEAMSAPGSYIAAVAASERNPMNRKIGIAVISVVVVAAVGLAIWFAASGGWL